jgi:hypothetical protein
VKTFRGVKTVIIGNEPNRKNFMSPPKPDYYGRVLAGAYAAVKSVDPSIEVLGRRSPRVATTAATSGPPTSSSSSATGTAPRTSPRRTGR